VKIRQAKVARSIEFFRPQFLKKYKFDSYGDPHSPSIFFGCYYDPLDYNAILNHQNLGVIIWAGSDAMHIDPGFIEILKNKSNLYNIAISKYISDDLKNLEIPHIYRPITPTSTNSEDIRPSPLGEEVYIYYCVGKENFYGVPTAKTIEKETGYPFQYCHLNSHTKNDLKQIYKQSFAGLRLTPHDGFPNTVIELGLRGRKCCWGGSGIPNAVRCETLEEITAFLKREYSRASEGICDKELAEKVYEYLNHYKRDWTEEEFYLKGQFNTLTTTNKVWEK